MFWLNSNGAIIVNADGLPINCDYCPCVSSINYDIYYKDYWCQLIGADDNQQPQTDYHKVYHEITRQVDYYEWPSSVYYQYINDYNVIDGIDGVTYENAVKIKKIVDSVEGYDHIQDYVLYKNDEVYGQDIYPNVCNQTTITQLNYNSYGKNRLYQHCEYTYRWKSFMISSNVDTDPDAVGLKMNIKQIQYKTNSLSSVVQFQVDLYFGQEYTSLPSAILEQPSLISSAVIYQIPLEQRWWQEYWPNHKYNVSGQVYAPSGYFDNYSIQISAVRYLYE